MLICVKNNGFAEKMQKNVKNFVGGVILHIFAPQDRELLS